MTDAKHIHNLNFQKSTRQILRNNSTQAEAVLWRALKGSQIAGRKFRRQHGIGAYVVDFYCPAESLIIELDGAGHFTASGEANDVARTEYLVGLGFRVLRFENRVVLEQLDNVLAAIQAAFLPENAPRRLPTTPNPSSAEEGN